MNEVFYFSPEAAQAAGASEAAIAQTEAVLAEIAAEDACPISQKQADMCRLISKGLSYEELYRRFDILFEDTEIAKHLGDSETVAMNEWWLRIYREVLHYTSEKRKYEELLASIKEPSVVAEQREVYNKWWRREQELPLLARNQAKTPEAVE